MGQSTDAILFYGYCWDEEMPTQALYIPGWDEQSEDESDPPEWSEIIAQGRGKADPWKNFPAGIEQIRDYDERRKAADQWVKDHQDELDEWSGLKASIMKEFGCDIDDHCSSECSMPFVYVLDSIVRANRGHPEQLLSNRLNVSEEWDRMLTRFISELGIDVPGIRGWWLVSDWTW